MFRPDGLFGGKDQAAPKDLRRVGAAPAPNASAAPRLPQPEMPRADAGVAPAPLRTAENKASRLTVGPDIKLRGAEITDCDTLVVEGRVEASMDSRVMQIAEHGVFSGTAGIDIAEIHGRFEGDLTARRQLVIHATGSVTGKVRYGKLSIEEGGQLAGDVAALEGSPAARRDRDGAPKSPVGAA